jgi:hypothetical protein
VVVTFKCSAKFVVALSFTCLWSCESDTDRGKRAGLLKAEIDTTVAITEAANASPAAESVTISEVVMRGVDWYE